MPRSNNPGGAWNETDKARLVHEVVSGTLSVSEACARHGLSQDCIREWVRVFRHSAIQAFDEHLRQTLVTQGIDVGDALPAGFNGSLSDIALTDLIQTITQSRRDGLITVVQEGSESRIWCKDGEIVDAESGRLRGEPALYRTLALKSGRVSAEFVQSPRVRTIHKTTAALLLNGACQMDECNVLLERFGAARYGLAAEAALDAREDAAEQGLVQLFATPRTLREALTESDVGDLWALTGIARLIERGTLCVEVKSPLPIATRLPDAPSTAPMMFSFLPTVADRSLRPVQRSKLRRGAATLVALGFIAWQALSPLFSSSNASSRVAARVPEQTQAASVAALAIDPRVPASEPSVLAAERAEEPPAPVQETAAAAAAPPRTDKAPAASQRARSRGRVPLPPLAIADRQEPRPEATGASDTEGTPRTAPRMQIIDEQTPRMQIVE